MRVVSGVYPVLVARLRCWQAALDLVAPVTKFDLRNKEPVITSSQPGGPPAYAFKVVRSHCLTPQPPPLPPCLLLSVMSYFEEHGVDANERHQTPDNAVMVPAELAEVCNTGDLDWHRSEEAQSHRAYSSCKIWVIRVLNLQPYEDWTRC